MDLAWCPVCERAIAQDEEAPSPVDLPSRPSSSASNYPVPRNASSSRLSKLKQGATKSRPHMPHNSCLRRNGSSGKNLAMTARASFAPIDADAKKGTKRVQMAEDPSMNSSRRIGNDDRLAERRPVQLYCSEACQQFDEAHAEEAFVEVAPHRVAHLEAYGSLVSPYSDSESGDASSHPSEGPGSANWKRMSLDVAKLKWSTDSIASLSLDDTPVSASGSSHLQTRGSTVRGSRIVPRIGTIEEMGNEEMPSLGSRPLSSRSKSHDDTRRRKDPSPPSTLHSASNRHSYETSRHTPRLLAPNGTPLIQPTFTKPSNLSNHIRHKNASTPSWSPPPLTRSQTSDSSAAITMDGFTRSRRDSETRVRLPERPEKATSLYQDYGLFYQPAAGRRCPSSASLASYSRSPPADGLSTSLGSMKGFRGRYLDAYSSATPTLRPSTGPSDATPRHASTSSMATSARRDSTSSSTWGGTQRSSLLRPSASDSDHSSPPSSPGLGPTVHPAVASVISSSQADAQDKCTRSWSWDHLPPYVPQYPAMDIEKIRRSRSGVQRDSTKPILAQAHVQSRKKLFTFAAED